MGGACFMGRHRARLNGLALGSHVGLNRPAHHDRPCLSGFRACLLKVRLKLSVDSNFKTGVYAHDFLH
jgi:hypothetical protein